MRTSMPVACAFAALAAGCFYQQRDLPWYVEDPSGALDEAAIVNTFILEDGCADFRFPFYEYRLKPLDPVDEAPDEMSDGDFCFLVLAYDAACTQIASGTNRVTLPLADGAADEVVSVVVREPSPIACDGLCGPSGCRRCAADDTFCDGPPRCCPLRDDGGDACAQEAWFCDELDP